MKKNVWLLTVIAIIVGLTAGCLNLAYVTERADPAIREMKDITKLGILPFNVRLEFNRLILAKIGDTDGSVIVGGTYPGVDKQVVVMVTAPDAASGYFVTQDRLSILARDVWAGYLSGSAPFDYTGANESWLIERISSGDETGREISGFPNVITVSETGSGLSTSPAVLSNMAANYGVDALLACDMSVYAEVIKATAEEIDNPGGPGNPVSLVEGQYAVTIEITYHWALFDGRSGKKLADSEAARTKFFNPKTPEKNIHPLPFTIRRGYELDRFLSSREYEGYFAKSIADELLPSLYFFVPYFWGHYVEKEEAAH